MKKLFLALTLICMIVLGISSCKPELKNIRGEVKSLGIDNDTLKTMVLSVNGQETIVTLKDAKFQNGLALEGDSIILDYIDGRNDTLRALVVTMLPKTIQNERTDSIQ